MVCTRYSRSQNLTSDFDLHSDTFHSVPTLDPPMVVRGSVWKY